MAELYLGSERQRSQFTQDSKIPQSNSIPSHSLGSRLLTPSTDARLLWGHRHSLTGTHWCRGEAELMDTDLSPWCLEEIDPVYSNCPRWLGAGDFVLIYNLA